MKTSLRPASARVSCLLETSSIKTPFPGWISAPSSFVSLFIFYILFYLPSKTMGCFSGCLMSAASDQKLFCELCSAFDCSFDEFVGEKVVSPVLFLRHLDSSLCCLVSKSFPTLLPLMDRSLPGSSVQGISQVRIVQWVSISSSRGYSEPRDQICTSCIGSWISYQWATWEAHWYYIYAFFSWSLSSRNCHLLYEYMLYTRH